MNNPYIVDRAMPGTPQQSMFSPMMPTSYSAQTRYYSPAPSSGFDQRDINNMSYDQLVRAARTGGLIYNDPNAPQQAQQGMFSSSMMPQMPQLPTNFGGVSYPQFNMFNPYAQGMFNPFMMMYGSPYGSNF